MQNLSPDILINGWSTEKMTGFYPMRDGYNNLAPQMFIQNKKYFFLKISTSYFFFYLKNKADVDTCILHYT